MGGPGKSHATPLLLYLLAKPRYSAQGSKGAEEAGRASQR